MLSQFRDARHRAEHGVGASIGAAFCDVIASSVGAILIPPLGLLIGAVYCSSLFVALSGHSPSLAAAKEAGVSAINSGVLLNLVLEFLIVAGATFLLIQQGTRFMKPAPSAVRDVRAVHRPSH